MSDILYVTLLQRVFHVHKAKGADRLCNVRPLSLTDHAVQIFIKQSDTFLCSSLLPRLS